MTESATIEGIFGVRNRGVHPRASSVFASLIATLLTIRNMDYGAVMLCLGNTRVRVEIKRVHVSYDLIITGLSDRSGHIKQTIKFASNINWAII